MSFVWKVGPRQALRLGRIATLGVGILAVSVGAGAAQVPPPPKPAGPPGQPAEQPGTPGVDGARVVGMPGTPSITDMQKNKIEYLRASLDTFKRDLKPRGPQGEAFATFDRTVMASIPVSVKYVRDFCEDPTPQEGRGSFGESAKRIAAIREILKGRQAVLQELDAATLALHQSVSSSAEQAQVYDQQMPTLIKLVTSVPFGLPDTGLPLNCSTVNGVPAGDTKFAPPPGSKLPEPILPRR